MARVTVVIPNWNGAHHLRECFDSLAQQDFEDFEVILIEDASTDDSAKVAAEYPWVKMIQLERHMGFAYSCNLGITSSDSEFVLLLNNDTRCYPDFIGEFVAAMDAHPEASLAAAKMLRYDPPHPIDSAGDAIDLRRGTPYTMGMGDSSEAYSEPGWVLSACAGAAIYRRRLFEDIGLFDEDFYFTSEDVDISLRALNAGHRCLYAPKAIVLHKRGISFHQPSARIRAIAMRNRIWVIGRNLPWSGVLQSAVHAAYRSARWLGWRVKRRLGGHRDYPKEDQIVLARELLRAILHLPKKRMSVRHLRRVDRKLVMSMVREPRRPVSEPPF